MLSPKLFFDLAGSRHAGLFSDTEFAWDALKRLPGYVARVLGVSADELAARPGGGADLIEIGQGAMVEEGAKVVGPAIIGPGSRVYAGSLVRGPVILGEGAVVGHCSEVTASVLLEGSRVPHLNFVGHSILGARVNLGAGTVCSNLKFDEDPVIVRVSDQQLETGLSKFGAVLGDDVQVGCNSVLNPGCLIGPRCWVYGGAQLRGCYPADHIIKVDTKVRLVPRT